jgi:opacity protein-like surface antigen
MRRLTVLGFAFLFLATAATAQTDSKGNIAFGYSYARANLSSKSALAPTISSSNLNGWFVSAEYKVIPWLGVVGDFGGNYGTERVVPFCEVIPICPSPLNAQAHVQTFLAGPRASVSIGKVTPFAQALFGGAHTSASGTGFSSSDTSFATALGGGVDLRLAKTLAWRVQGDYLQTRFFTSSQNNFRFSTGLVVRF